MTNIEREAMQRRTLEFFSEFVHEELPQILKRNIAEGKAKSYLNFNLKENGKTYPARMAIFEYESETNKYSIEVIKEELMMYMRRICLSGFVKSPDENGDAWITVDTAKLVNLLLDKCPELIQFPEIDWASDFTYDVFQDFVLNEVPKIVERCKKEGQANSYFEFNLEETGENFPEKLAMFKYESDTNTYCAKVKKDEFMSYMLRMPFMRYRKPTNEYNGSSFIAFNTGKLDEFYLEELQREVNQVGRAI